MKRINDIPIKMVDAVDNVLPQEIQVNTSIATTMQIIKKKDLIMCYFLFIMD